MPLPDADTIPAQSRRVRLQGERGVLAERSWTRRPRPSVPRLQVAEEQFVRIHHTLRDLLVRVARNRGQDRPPRRRPLQLRQMPVEGEGIGSQLLFEPCFVLVDAVLPVQQNDQMVVHPPRVEQQIVQMSAVTRVRVELLGVRPHRK